MTGDEILQKKTNLKLETPNQMASKSINWEEKKTGF